MKWHEQALLLLEKAGEDEYALNRLLDDPNVSEAVIGFHAQQAVEKALKAVLAEKRIEFHRTHDLATLLDLVNTHGIAYPPEWEKITELIPFAAEFRYGKLPPDEDVEAFLDRRWAGDMVRQMIGWAKTLIVR